MTELIPADAATLIILRNREEVLLGMRNSNHVFMPHRYVFPGGRVDAQDRLAPCPLRLSTQVETALLQSVDEDGARALAMAAVRETWEESGLALGHFVEESLSTDQTGWQAFFELGFAPALDHLHYLGRAITPPGRSRRFDARFFVVDASHITGELKGNGELGNLHWVKLRDYHDLFLADITRLILQLLADQLAPGATPATVMPQYEHYLGSELIELRWLEL